MKAPIRRHTGSVWLCASSWRYLLNIVGLFAWQSFPAQPKQSHFPFGGVRKGRKDKAMDCKQELVNLITSHVEEEKVAIPMNLAIDIAMELERLSRIRQALDPDQRDY